MRVHLGTITCTLALLLGLGVAAAGQGSILLQGGAGQPITFTGQGAGTDTIAVTLAACDSSGVCTLSGTGTGSGSAAITSSGTFTMTSSPNSTILTPYPPGAALGEEYYDGSTSEPECYVPYTAAFCGINFALTGSTNGQTGTLLASVLDLLNFQQVLGSNQGSFNEFFPYPPGEAPTSQPTSQPANLFITKAGLLYKVFPDDGALQLNVQFPTSENVSALVGTNQSLAGALLLSTLAPTPEPSSLALIGAGLLVLGVCVRLHGRTQITA